MNMLLSLTFDILEVFIAFTLCMRISEHGFLNGFSPRDK